MHTEQDILDIVSAIGAVMVLGTKGLGGYEQAQLETDAIAVYLASQIATFKDEADREAALQDVARSLREAVDARVKKVSEVSP